MTARSLALAVGTVAIEHRRMTRSGIGLRVNRIAPEPRYARPPVARRQRPDRRVVGPDHLLADDILADALGHRQHPPGDMPHPLGHGGAVDLDAFALQDDGLPVERDAIAVFRDGDVGEQSWSRPPFLDRQFWRRRLEHNLTHPA